MTEKTKTPAPVATAAPAETPRINFRLGEQIFVKLAPGRELLNGQTGLNFVADEPTEVVVTITTLKRLADGDLIAV